MMRFDQLAHSVTSVISTLTREKSELESRLKELSELLDQERSIAKQQEKLFSSNKGETEQRLSELAELRSKLSEQEAISRQQLLTIAQLEEACMTGLQKLEALQQDEQVKLTETTTQQASLADLEKNLASITLERDALRSKVQATERADATWAVKLSRGDVKAATQSLDAIAKKLEIMEQRILQATEETSVVQSEIFQSA